MLHKLYCVFNNLNSIYDNFLSKDTIELFNPKYAKYEFMHLGFTKNGSYIDWESSFIHRIFNEQERLNEYERLFRKKIYSIDNINYINPYIVNKYDCINLRNIDNYIKIENLKYSNFDIRFLLGYDEANLYLLFYIDDSFFNVMEKFKLVFNIFNNTSNGPRTQSISIVNDNGKLFCLYDNTNKSEIQTILHLKEGRVIKIDIPYNFLLVDLHKSEKKLCYYIKLAENIYKDYFQCIGGKYFDSNLPGVIKIPF